MPQVKIVSLGLRVTAGDPSGPSVLARVWHGRAARVAPLRVPVDPAARGTAHDREPMAGVVTFLEMTAPTQLRPARHPPVPLEMEEAGPAAAPLLRLIYVRVWGALASGGRMDWPDVRWEDELARRGVRARVARIGGDPAGFVELEVEPDGDVGIVVFGLVPEFTGRGFGGALLTWATQTAWALTWQGGSTKRVWLQTSSDDHPHALPNYEHRGSESFASSRGPPQALMDDAPEIELSSPT